MDHILWKILEMLTEGKSNYTGAKKEPTISADKILQTT